MAKKTVTILSDKFKGTLGSAEVADIIAGTLARAGIDADFRCCVMADGGQGTAEALGCTADPSGMFHTFRINGNIAVYVPSCGENLSWAGNQADRPFNKRNTEPVGRAVKNAMSRYPGSKIYIGIGGTICADIGIGFLEELGYKFVRREGHIALESEPPAEMLSTYRKNIIGLADVRCPLTGKGLSALSFIPQKGGNDGDIASFTKTAACMEDIFGRASDVAHSGAGGGLGYAVETAIGCRVLDGATYVLDRVLAGSRSDLFITGEGMIDGQTGGGKVVDAVYRHASSCGSPVIAFCGKKSPDCRYDDAYPCVPFDAAVPASKTEAREKLSEAVRRALPRIKQML